MDRYTQQSLRRPQRSQDPRGATSNHNRRGLSLRYVVFAVGLILVGRLFYLQIMRHGHYEDLAIAEQQKKFVIPAQRGSLYFRDGDQIVPGVLNTDVYTLFADPKEVTHAEKAAGVLAGELGMNRSKVLSLLQTKNTSYAVIAKRLTRSKVDSILKHNKELVGINVTAVPQRVYPEGQLAAQALGFVNDEGDGQYGVEGALNKRLKGVPGVLKATTDVNGVPLSVDDRNSVAVQPKDGDNLVLTIDRNIQAKAEEALANGLKNSKATIGSVVVLDPNTGAVKAMANMPTYEPSKYYDVSGDAYQKFQNRVVSSPYEAGSVIKTLTMATGINDGAVNQNSTFSNSGSVRVDDAVIKNVEQDVNGTRNMTDVLKYSLNTGVVYVLSQLGGGNINQTARTKLYDQFAQKFGFGSLTGIEQSGEAEGTIFKPTAEQGNNVRYSNMAFGQGMDVTMIQVASAFSSVVNDGDYYQPHVVEGTVDANGHETSTAPVPLRKNVVSATTSAALREMTRTALAQSSAVNRLVRPGYNVGGKTGTSQTIDPATGKYSDNNTIGSYLGFGGDSKPRYVIMVRVDDSKIGGYAGSTAAAPIFGEISNWLIDYYNIKPM